MSVSSVVPQVVRSLVEAVLSTGTTPNELRGEQAVHHRAVVEAAAGIADASEETWRVVLGEVDSAYERILRGQGVSRPSRCDGCGQPIRWARTQAGRAMPLDPCPHPHGNVARVAGVAADVVEVRPTAELPIKGYAFRAHFVTCPSAGRFRRRGRFAPRCAVCRQPLHPLLVEAGESVHPCCDPRPGDGL